MSDTWHWMRNCSKWPLINYKWTEAAHRPSYGELCNECLAKERLAQR